MPNPALSQAQFDAVFDRFLEPLSAWLALREQWRRFAETKVRIDEVDGNGNAFTSSWTFTSFDVTTLTDGGKLYVRIADETPGAGQATVTLYRDTGAGSGDKVAEGSGNNSTTVTLAEQNSSGIAGTVAIGVVSASEANDKHYLICFPDFPQRARSVFDGGQSQDYGPDGLLENWQQSLRRIAQTIRAGMTECVRAAERILREYVSDKITSTDVTNIFNYALTQDSTSGAVTRVLSGLIEELRLSMSQNTTAQTILRKVPTAGSVTADSTNRGVLSWGTITLAPNARPGLVTAKCTLGGSANFGREEVTVSIKPSDFGGPRQDDAPIVATRKLRPGGVFRAPEIGIESVTASRDITKTGDGSNVEFASADPTFSGEGTENTNAGVVYGKVTGSAGNYTVSFYKASTVGAADLVAQATGVSSTYTATAQNDSGLTVSGSVGSSPTGATVTFDLNGLESDSNDGNVPDRWTFSLSDPAGLAEGIQDTIGEIWGPSAELNETASSETIPNGRITRGGPHPLRTVVMS